MNEPQYLEVLATLAEPPRDYVVEKITGGLINHSFKVTDRLSGETFFLQQINISVFNEPQLLQNNYELIWKHAGTRLPAVPLPAPHYFPDKNLLYTDSANRCWRMFEFVETGQSLPAVESSTQARLVAETFAGFTRLMDDIDSTRLHTTLPGFHDLALRYNQFEQSLHSHDLERLSRAAQLVQELRNRERYVSFFEVITQSGLLPKRVIHHDAKLSNLLFTTDGAAIAAITDLDTVMPGYFFSDLGDLVRTLSSTQPEDSTELTSLGIRQDIYEAVVNGYLLGLKDHLTEIELKYLHSAGLLMTFMQALRFCTDYLQGDKYYQIDYAGQNLDRAMNQLKLLAELEKHLLATHGFSILEAS